MSGSSSLGTMTVGVSANVDPATKAVDALIGRMDRLFEVVSKAGKGSGGLQEWERTFDRQRKAVDDMAKSYTDFRGIPTASTASSGTEAATKSMQDLGSQANRTRYAVLNLAYGVQDAATVFGTGGFAGALRASANNLTGLGIILANTQGGMAGLKAAMMGPEMAIIGIATVLMVAADAWQAYSKSVQDAMDKITEKRVRDLKPARAVEEAGREQGLQNELLAMKNIVQVEEKRKELANALQVAQAKLNAGLQQENLQSKRVGEIQKMLDAYDEAIAVARGPQVGGLQGQIVGPQLTKEQQAILVEVRERGGRAQLENNLKEAQRQKDEQAKSIEQLIRDKDNAVKDLKSAENRMKQLDPEQLKAAREKLELLQRQLKALEDQDGAQRKADQALQNRRNLLQDQARQYASAKERKEDIEMGLVTDVRERAMTRMYGQSQVLGANRHPLNLDQFLPGRFRLTEAEKRALREYEGAADELARLPNQAERVIVDKAQVEDQKRGILGQIAEIMGIYPQLDTKRTLEQQEADMEHRLGFLQKKHRKILASMANVPVASLESAAAYESLARSRMGGDPQTDVLQKVLEEERKATRELEKIREQLDPGRTQRIQLLETL
jgi:hypothetical protein